MKKDGPRKAKSRVVDEMRSEYRFDYSKAQANRFAQRMKKDAVAVLLDPDVATVFRTSEEVNSFLRSVIATLPGHSHKRAKAG
jgi:hypothetical protein